MDRDYVSRLTGSPPPGRPPDLRLPRVAARRNTLALRGRQDWRSRQGGPVPLLGAGAHTPGRSAPTVDHATVQNGFSRVGATPFFSASASTSRTRAPFHSSAFNDETEVPRYRLSHSIALDSELLGAVELVALDQFREPTPHEEGSGLVCVSCCPLNLHCQ